MKYFFPKWGYFLARMPPWLSKILNPGSGPLAYFRTLVRQQSAEALQQGSETTRNKKRSIFDALTDPDVPAEERTLDRLTEEGMIVLGAGAETTANTLLFGAYHLIKNRTILLKLREELKSTVMPHPDSTPTWNQLEQLPYLVCTSTLSTCLS